MDGPEGSLHSQEEPGEFRTASAQEGDDSLGRHRKCCRDISELLGELSAARNRVEGRAVAEGAVGHGKEGGKRTRNEGYGIDEAGKRDGQNEG